jgi:uncharacterized protein YdeI (YjbR/CyaY-like superfamily)
MARAIDSFSSYYPKDRTAWRNWLQKNYNKYPGIWLIYYKTGTSKPRLPYADMVEEALCFGWIDSLPRKLDEERTMLLFTPRKPKSVWSDLNKTRIEKLIRNGLMMQPGLETIETAKKNGSWDTLNASNHAANTNELPQYFMKAFNGKKKALENFKAFSPSVRRQFLYWLDSAKTEETRNKRLQQTLLMSEANKKPGPQGFKL